MSIGLILIIILVIFLLGGFSGRFGGGYGWLRLWLRSRRRRSYRCHPDYSRCAGALGSDLI